MYVCTHIHSYIIFSVHSFLYKCVLIIIMTVLRILIQDNSEGHCREALSLSLSLSLNFYDQVYAIDKLPAEERNWSRNTISFKFTFQEYIFILRGYTYGSTIAYTHVHTHTHFPVGRDISLRKLTFFVLFCFIILFLQGRCNDSVLYTHSVFSNFIVK